MKILKNVVVLILALVAGLTAAQAADNHQTSTHHPQKKLVLLVSIDGFRNDYINRDLSSHLLALAEKGTHAQRFEPVFPSITFPNHYSQVTGLYPDHNGIVNNTMFDPSKTAEVFKLSDRKVMENSLWWEEGIPLWVTLQRQGKISSTLFWVGSEAMNHGLQPNDWLPYDNHLSSSARTQQLLRWLDRDDKNRADFATLYFSEVDAAGHEYGPDSDEVNAAIARVDQAIGELVDGLRSLDLLDKTTLIITSDHGMAHVAPDHATDLSAFTSGLASAKIQWTGPLSGFDVNSAEKASLLSRLRQDNHMNCWAKEEMPSKYHFGTHRRIPQVVCLSQPGWSTVASATQKVIPGQHGYDPIEPDMQGLFIINGPGIKTVELDRVRNIDIYNLLVHLLNVKGEKSDGDDTLYARVKVFEWP